MSLPAQTIVQLARPSYVNGRWRKPKLSGMKLANLRKEYLLSGQEFPEIPKNKVITDYIAPPRVPKGHKHEREKEVRQKKIKDAMAKMPKMIADWKKSIQLERRKARPISEFLSFRAEPGPKGEKRKAMTVAMKFKKEKEVKDKLAAEQKAAAAAASKQQKSSTPNTKTDNKQSKQQQKPNPNAQTQAKPTQAKSLDSLD